MLELIACHRRRWKFLNIVAQCFGFVSRRAYAHVAGLDRPGGSALRRGHPAYESQRRPLLLLARILEQVEIATARGAATLGAHGQHGHTKLEARFAAHRTQITGGVPHHGGGLFKEVLTQRAPLDDALRHGLVLLGKRYPVLQRLDSGRVIEVDFGTRFIHQAVTVLKGKSLKHPVGIAGRGHHDAPLLAVGCLTHGHRHFSHLLPVFRWHFRIETGGFESVLVPEQHNRGALEGNAVGLAINLTVLHQPRVKTVQPFAFLIGFDYRVESDDGVLLQQVKQVDREQDRQLWRLACLDSRHRPYPGIVIVTGIDRVHRDIRMLAFEIGDQLIDDLRQRPTHGNRVVHGQFRLSLSTQRAGSKQAGQNRCFQAGRLRNLALHEWKACVHRFTPGESILARLGETRASLSGTNSWPTMVRR